MDVIAGIGSPRDGAKQDTNQMAHKDYWKNAKVGVIGGGSWGTVLANAVSHNCQEVRVWLRDEESVSRSIVRG